VYSALLFHILEREGSGEGNFLAGTKRDRSPRKEKKAEKKNILRRMGTRIQSEFKCFIGERKDQKKTVSGGNGGKAKLAKPEEGKRRKR